MSDTLLDRLNAGTASPADMATAAQIIERNDIRVTELIAANTRMVEKNRAILNFDRDIPPLNAGDRIPIVAAFNEDEPWALFYRDGLSVAEIEKRLKIPWHFMYPPIAMPLYREAERVKKEIHVALTDIGAPGGAILNRLKWVSEKLQQAKEPT